MYQMYEDMYILDNILNIYIFPDSNVFYFHFSGKINVDYIMS